MTTDERQQATFTYKTIHRQPADLRNMFAREQERGGVAALLLRTPSACSRSGSGPVITPPRSERGY